MNFRNPKNLLAKVIVKILKKHGFAIARIKGDHAVFKNTNTKAVTVVSLGRKSFSSNEILNISNQSGISRDLFRK
jgi:predicted RNA binding protein YcfA (HicA-like mRNA interferase family)